jgi:hypothetical protein
MARYRIDFCSEAGEYDANQIGVHLSIAPQKVPREYFVSDIGELVDHAVGDDDVSLGLEQGQISDNA